MQPWKACKCINDNIAWHKLNIISNYRSPRWQCTLLHYLARATLRSFVLFGLLVGVGQMAHARDYFRYVDSSGIMVLSHTIPAARVPFGYDIVDETGRLIKHIAPQLSESEYLEKQQQEEMMSRCNAAVKRVNKAYQTSEDIDNAERQSLAGIETAITNARANLRHARNQRTELESQAAQKDLEGKTIPNKLLDNIESARGQEKNLTETIDDRLAQKLDQRIHYRYDRKIFDLVDCEDGLPGRS